MGDPDDHHSGDLEGQRFDVSCSSPACVRQQQAQGCTVQQARLMQALGRHAMMWPICMLCTSHSAVSRSSVFVVVDSGCKHHGRVVVMKRFSSSRGQRMITLLGHYRCTVCTGFEHIMQARLGVTKPNSTAQGIHDRPVISLPHRTCNAQ